MSRSGMAISPVEMLRGVRRNRELLALLVRREVVGRYRGSLMGLAWSFFHPLLMLLVFTVFFSFVFKARWGSHGGGTGEFAVNVFIGLILHGFLAECINRAPTVVVANVNFVKKILFPLETLCMVVLGAALFHLVISFAVLFAMLPFFRMGIHWTALLVPVVVFPLAAMVLGLSWMLASLGVFARDVTQVTGVLASVLLFASPVFYPASALAEPFSRLLMVNPLTYPIEQVRTLLFTPDGMDWRTWIAYTAVSMVVAWLGFAFFQRTRTGFADVV